MPESVGPQAISVDLPPGQTCGDCQHMDRCNKLFGHVPADTSCDWYPIRFRPKIKET